MRRFWSVATSGSRMGCFPGSTRRRAPTTRRRGAISATPMASYAAIRPSRIPVARFSCSNNTTSATRRRWWRRLPVVPRRSSWRWPTSSVRPVERIVSAPSCMRSAGPCIRLAVRSFGRGPLSNFCSATSVDPAAVSMRCVDMPMCRGRLTTPSWPASCRVT